MLMKKIEKTKKKSIVLKVQNVKVTTKIDKVGGGKDGKNRT